MASAANLRRNERSPLTRPSPRAPPGRASLPFPKRRRRPVVRRVLPSSAATHGPTRRCPSSQLFPPAEFRRRSPPAPGFLPMGALRCKSQAVHLCHQWSSNDAGPCRALLYHRPVALVLMDINLLSCSDESDRQTSVAGVSSSISVVREDPGAGSSVLISDTT